LTKRNVPALFWALVVCLLLAHNAYLWLGKRIAPDTDILALLPVEQRDPVLQQALTHIVESAQQRLIVLVGADDWAAAVRAADAYGATLAGRSDLLETDGRIGDQKQNDWLELFQRHRLGLVTSHDEAALRNQPKESWVDAALARLYSPFAGPKPGAWQDDPFGLFADWVQARAQETPVRPRDGRLFVGDGARQFVVMPLALRVPAFSMAAGQAVMPLLDQARRAAQRAVPQVEVIQAGVILHAAAAAEQARREVSIIGVGSIAGIVLLMWLAFHSLKPIAWVMLSIAVGCLGGISAAWLLFERVHLLTLVFGASLIGVAQDYGIYFLCKKLSADAKLDSHRLLRRLLAPLALTLVTTVIGYMALALTPFPGLRQMAVFSAVGLVFAWLTVVFWFPALTRSTTLKSGGPARWYAATLALWPLFQRNRATFAAGIFFVAFAAAGLARLEVRDDIRLLQNPAKNLIDDQIKASGLLDAPAPAQFYLVRGATPEAVLQREEMLKARLDPLIDKRVISGYHAISNWAPSLRAQAADRQLIEEKLLNEGGALAALAPRVGENARWTAAMRDRLLASASPLAPDDFLKTPAGEPWRHLWLGRVDGGYGSIVALRGLGYAGLPVLRQLAAGLDGIQWVDQVGEISSVLGRYRQYMGWIVLVSYVAVYGLLYPRYRDAAWRVLAPTALASVAALALLGIAGEHLQLFHILALMLLLGIGVDYGIFLQEDPGRRDHAAWLAVGLSAVSTLLSFGLLGLSRTPALQAFGVTMLIGIATVWLIVPAFGAPTRKES
jgi:predicted exporter